MSRELGDKGEDLAAEFLVKKGYKILERNWTSGHKEIDIIAEFENTLIVIEVKTLSYASVKEPQLAVNKNKQKLLIAATNDYLAKKELDYEVRFDVLALILNQRETRIEHIEAAFRAY